MVDRVGQQLGNYRLLRLLGQGGFADVYLGEHLYVKTHAALKVLQIRLVNQALEDFLNEARTLFRLEHPHIVRVLECGVESQIPFLVMSYAPGGSLRQRYPTGSRLRPDELLPYMAPEQINGKPRPASDQYSLGIVVYEWLSGARPFQGSFVEVATQHMMTPPLPLCGRVPGVTPALERVVLTALAKDPQQRFASIQAFAAALEEAYQSGPNQSSHLSSGIPSPDQSLLSTFVNTPPGASSQPSMPLGAMMQSTYIKTPVNVSPGMPSQISVVPAIPIDRPLTAAPSTRLLQPTDSLAPADQPFQPPVSAVSQGQYPSVEVASFKGKQKSQQRISRRRVVMGIAGLAGATAMVAGSTAWMVLSQGHTGAFVSTPVSKSTAFNAQTASPGANPGATPTASSTSTPGITTTSNPTPISKPPVTPDPTASSVPLGQLLFTYKGHSIG